MKGTSRSPHERYGVSAEGPYQRSNSHHPQALEHMEAKYEHKPSHPPSTLGSAIPFVRVADFSTPRLDNYKDV
jgi:hypothetical protein